MLGPNFRSNNVRLHICPNFQGFSTNQNYWGCNYTPWPPPTAPLSPHTTRHYKRSISRSRLGSLCRDRSL